MDLLTYQAQVFWSVEDLGLDLGWVRSICDCHVAHTNSFSFYVATKAPGQQGDIYDIFMVFN